MADDQKFPARPPDTIHLHRAESLIWSENGVSESEIAQRHNVSRSTARRDVQYARATMRGGQGTLSLSEKGVSYRPSSKRSRKTKDRDIGVYSRITSIIAPDDHETDWRRMELDRDTLNKLTPTQLIEILINTSPAMSRALWDVLRLCDPGHKIDVFRPGTKEEDPVAKEQLDKFLSVLKKRHGSIKILSGELFISAYIRGAMFCELVLNQKREPVDLVIVDPYSARFKVVDDPETGPRYQLGQWQQGKWVDLDIPTVRYLAVDKFFKPYGRSPATPAIFPCLFLLGLAHDLRRVVAQQGYPRIDIAVNLEKLAAAYPKEHKKGGQDWDDLIDATLTEIVRTYDQLEPEDAFVHTDDQEVKRPVGALDSQAVQAADALIKGLERMAVQALKTEPLLLGITDGVSEANANRQWEIQVAGIKSLQHLAETMLGSQFEVALEAMGIIADVKVTYSELRASEMQRDELTRQTRTQNTAYERDQGWITPLEAAKKALEHDVSPEVVEHLKDQPIRTPVDPAEIEKQKATAGTPNNADADPDPGETKAVEEGMLFRFGDRTFLVPKPEEKLNDAA